VTKSCQRSCHRQMRLWRTDPPMADNLMFPGFVGVDTPLSPLLKEGMGVCSLRSQRHSAAYLYVSWYFCRALIVFYETLVGA
jgi:hypothetical protein